MIQRDLAEYQFIIPGACPPKGSRVPVGKRRATRESSKRVEPWTKAAIPRLQDGHGKPRATFSGPVYVELTFVFKRPKVTEFEFPTAPNIGDLDKLTRCVLDALTKAKVIEDDRFVVKLGDPEKHWGSADCTIVRVGHARLGPREPFRIFSNPVPNPFSPAKPRCPARGPGGDGWMCTCADPAACGAASVERK